MQTVSHKPNINPIFDDIDRFYAMTSEQPNSRNKLCVFDTSFDGYLRLFSSYGNTTYDCTVTPKKYQKLTYTPPQNKTMVVCFSGGKDSTAAVLHYQKLGYRVVLFHVRWGANGTPQGKDDYEASQRVAEHLGLPLFVESVEVKGKRGDWLEHPLKNSVMASLALQFAIENGYGTNIAFGNYYTSSVRDDPFWVCGGDDKEMWRAFEKVVRKVLPGFTMHIPLRNIQSSYLAVLQRPELLPKIQSCLGSYRYREYLHNYNEKRYGVKLLPHRCGSCWKCATEYIWFTDHDVLDYSEKFYRHCIDILRRTTRQETGVRVTEEDAWLHYMFYSKKLSKYFQKPLYK